MAKKQNFAKCTQSGAVFAAKAADMGADYVPATRAEYVEGLKTHLLGFIQPKTKIYTLVVSVARSGMARTIKVYVTRDNGQDIRDISYYVAEVTGNTLAKDGGVKMQGCGMDMGFALVYALGSALWPAGTGTPHGMRNGEPDTTGGYALKQQWL